MIAITASLAGRPLVLQQDRPEGDSEVLPYQYLLSLDGDVATFQTAGGTVWTAKREGGDWLYEGSRITVLRD